MESREQVSGRSDGLGQVARYTRYGPTPGTIDPAAPPRHSEVQTHYIHTTTTPTRHTTDFRTTQEARIRFQPDSTRPDIAMAYNFVRSYIDTFRERTAAISHTSTFRETGQITPEEFVLAGDFLVFKFPSWQWADASSPSKRVSYLPEGKQFLVTRGVPCHRRLDDNFAGEAGQDETIVRDGFTAGEGATDDDGWLRTGGMAASQEAKVRDVRTVDESGNLGAAEDDDEIPDMEDIEDDDEAIIRDPKAGSNTQA